MPNRWLIDYDSTIADTQSLRLDWTNQRFGTEYNREAITTWLSEGYFDPEHAKFMWGPECFMSEDFQFRVPPVEGAIESVQALIDAGHHCMIISDRPAELFEVTRDWLDRNGLDMVRLLFTRHKHSLNADGGKGYLTKLQAAYLYKLTHVIEDAPHHSFNLALKSYIERVYLLDMPYNESVEHPKITRVMGWADLLDVALATERWLVRALEAGVYV